MLGGVLADYIGRKRMMMIAIAAYSIATGLSALATNWWSFALLRLLVGITVGSEWATGSSMMAELWPDNARGKGAGLMQCGLGVGFFVAAAVWLVLAPIGPGAWRYMYLLGVLPALLVLWIRGSVAESRLWQQAKGHRVEVENRRKSGERLTAADAKVIKFTLIDLLTDKPTQKITLLVSLMSLATTVGFWSISTWVPQYVGSLAGAHGLSAARWASFAGMAYTAGSITGYIAFGFLADALGRKPVTFLFFLFALLATPLLFFGSKDLTAVLALSFVNAIFTNGQYTWMPVWLPEFYPTRIRATALAFVFNAPRFIACIGPLVAGTLIASFGGVGWAALAFCSVYLLGIFATLFLPETRGKPLPA
jgi:MFS family permease